MKAITVCVNYADILAITLPKNRRFFDRYLIVTSPDDEDTKRLAAIHNCELLLTNAFYLHGAMFNKGLAMEEGFEALGRDGWITILDADTMLPHDACFDGLQCGYLYSPRRYMLDDPKDYTETLDWSTLRIRPDYEHCGYCTIFNGNDPVLKGVFPWYGINWSHSGGCDSEFQSKWELVNKYRPEWKVLHLGPTDTNWCGRVSGLEGGMIVDQRRENMRQVITTYRRPELNVPMPEFHKVKNDE